jgi:hypothetical protein
MKEYDDLFPTEAEKSRGRKSNGGDEPAPSQLDSADDKTFGGLSTCGALLIHALQARQR